VEGSCQVPPPPTTSPPETVCPDGWTGHADHCYKYVDQKKNWTLARESCVAEYQAELVSIHNHMESDFVLSFFSGTKFWTGGRRECDSCEAFVWSDGTDWDFSNWRDGREPNNSTGPENCAEIGHYQDSWNDWKCDRQIHYMCKRGPLEWSCPEDWTEAGERCLLYVEDRLTWEEAEAVCNTEEAHLVSVLSQEENDLVFSLKSNSSKLWLGGTRACSDCSDWRWSDGSEWRWQYWDAAEPNNLSGTENCVYMGHHRANGHFTQRYFSAALNFCPAERQLLRRVFRKRLVRDCVCTVLQSCHSNHQSACRPGTGVKTPVAAVMHCVVRRTALGC